MEWVPQRDLQAERSFADLGFKAIGLRPDEEKSWLLYARSLMRLGRLEDARETLQNAVLRLPGSLSLRRELVTALQQSGLFEEALSQHRLVLEQAPDDAAGRATLFELQVATKNWAGADALADETARIAPWALGLFDVLARRPDHRALLADCDAALENRPLLADARYFKAVALARLGRLPEAQAVLDPPGLTEISLPSIPEGFGDAESFLSKLSEEIRRNPTLVADPRGKATRGGWQTRELAQPDAPAVHALLERIKQAIDVYAQAIASRSNDVFASARPKKAKLRAWAVLYGGDGFQTVHRHPTGWLSGVYYVSAARPDRENAYRGPLVLGARDSRDLPDGPAWRETEVEPVPGRLVLFPSFIPHATKPTAIDGARISLAFDVIPA